MKLYGAGQSRSFRALWALEEAQINYEYVAVIFGSDEENGSLSKDYRVLNAEGKVPTLVDDDLVLIESAAIINYIGARSNTRNLIPTDIALRAKYDEMCFFILTELEQGLWSNGKHRFALPEEYRIPEMLNTANFEFDKALNTLQNLFNPEQYALGQHFTLADILLAQTLSWAKRFEFDLPENLIAYQQRMYQRPACIKALEQVD